MKKSYIAGFIDGEGCIGIYNRGRKGYTNNPYISVELKVSNTNQKPLKKIKKKYGGTIYCRKRKNGFGTMPIYEYTLVGKSLTKLLKDIEPFVIIKKPQVKKALKARQILELSRKTRNKKGMFNKVSLKTVEIEERKRLIEGIASDKRIYA